MEAKNHSRKVDEFYEAARQSFIAKMKTEDEERSNLKFKIATFVIHELSHSTPSWFQNYFLSSIPGHDDNADIDDRNIAYVENAFHDAIAAYLIKLESEDDYVKKTIPCLTNDAEKRVYWKPVVSDAFLIVGIYFAPSSGSLILRRTTDEKPMKKAARPVCRDQAFGFV